MPPQRKKAVAGKKSGNPFFARRRRAKNFTRTFSFSSEDPLKNLVTTYELDSALRGLECQTVIEVKLRYIFFATSHKIEAAAAIFESRLEAIMLEINILG